MNSVQLIGRLARDPELRYTAQGTAVANFTVACDRPPRPNGNGGETEKEADFIDVTVWGAQAESVCNFCQKGRRVGVEGRIEVRSYEDSQGTRRKGVRVVARRVEFLDWPRNRTEAQDASGGTFESEGDPQETEVPF